MRNKKMQTEHLYFIYIKKYQISKNITANTKLLTEKIKRTLFLNSCFTFWSRIDNINTCKLTKVIYQNKKFPCCT